MLKMTTDEFNMTAQQVIEEAAKSGIEIDRFSMRNILRCKHSNHRKKLMRLAEELGIIEFELNPVQKSICLDFWERAKTRDLWFELKAILRELEGSGDLIRDIVEALDRTEPISNPFEKRLAEIRKALKTGDYSQEMEKDPVKYTLAAMYWR